MATPILHIRRLATPAASLVLCLLYGLPTASALTVTRTQDLAFGPVVGGRGYGGTVTVDAAENRWYSGGLHPTGSAYSVARFVITGAPSAAYTIILPASFTITAGGNAMTVSGLAASVPLTGNLPPSGVLPFAVGGTMTVGAGQSNTVYSGSLDITVTTN